MNCEVVAIGTELLLGTVVDTNSSWIGEQLALVGIDCYHQVKVGDNLARMIDTLQLALARADAVIVCGGLGPTQDDITRQAIAAVMGTTLERDPVIVERIRAMFAARSRPMPENNLLQADVPVGAATIPVQPGTAPGLVCPVGDKVIYAVPGVPHEMRTMVGEFVLPDLERRAGITSAILSRTLRTWGQSESGLAEMLDERMAQLDELGNATLAFNASGIEGIKVRITAKCPTPAEALAVLDAEEQVLRGILGDLVFGVDDENMEAVVVRLLHERRLSLAAAESVTGGLVTARLTTVRHSSEVFRGGVIAYQPQVKYDLLGVAHGPVVTAEAAVTMAEGVAKLLGADVGLATTGVAGPDPLEGIEPGTVFVAVALPDGSHSAMVRLPGDRERVRQYSTISLLDLLRRRLLALP